MYSKYLKCDECGDVLDRRAKDDFGGSNRNTKGHGTFAPGEWPQLVAYAKSLGWAISGDGHDGRHVCPKHLPPLQAILDREAQVRADLNNPAVIEIDVPKAFFQEQIGLRTIAADPLGRIWDVSGNPIRMIFDPLFLTRKKPDAK